MSEREIGAVVPIYVADERSDRVTRECLAAVARELPDAQRIAAIDRAPTDVLSLASDLGFQLVTLALGEPPRLNRLLGESAQEIRVPLMLVVESDIILAANAGAQLRTLSRLFDDEALGAVELTTIKADGTITYPIYDRYLRASGESFDYEGETLFVDPWYPTFSGVIFRTSDLRSVDWGGCAPLAGCDRHAWLQIKKRALVCSSLRALHYIHVAREAAWAIARKAESEGAA